MIEQNKTVDFRDGRDDTPIKIMNHKPSESWVFKVLKYLNPEAKNITDVKNFMANERTFLNLYSLSFMISTFGVTIVKLNSQ